MASVRGSSDFPNKAIQVIVPFATGGGADISVRTLSKYAEESLGQKIVIQNVTGRSVMVGLTQLASAAPDGYTLGYFSSTNSIDNLLFEGIQYGVDSFELIFPGVFVVQLGGIPSDAKGYPTFLIICSALLTGALLFKSIKKHLSEQAVEVAPDFKQTLLMIISYDILIAAYILLLDPSREEFLSPASVDCCRRTRDAALTDGPAVSSPALPLT